MLPPIMRAALDVRRVLRFAAACKSGNTPGSDRSRATTRDLCSDGSDWARLRAPLHPADRSARRAPRNFLRVEELSACGSDNSDPYYPRAAHNMEILRNETWVKRIENRPVLRRSARIFFPAAPEFRRDF